MSQLTPAGRLAATFLLILLAAAAAAAAVSAQPSPHDQEVSGCQNVIDALWRACKQFVQKEGPKQAPSEDCCKTLRATDADAPCICDYLSSPDARNKLSLDKVFYVTNQCGINVPEGCGQVYYPRSKQV